MKPEILPEYDFRQGVRGKYAARYREGAVIDYKFQPQEEPNMTNDAGKTVRFTAELSEEQAWQFAQFLKRIGIDHYRQLSPSNEDAYIMAQAGEALRKALAEAGYAPR